MNRNKWLVIFCVLFSANCFAEINIMFKGKDFVYYDPTDESCIKINDYSVSYREEISRKFNVPMSSIRYNRNVINPKFGWPCGVLFDTAAGVKQCLVKSVFYKDSNKKMYMATPRYFYPNYQNPNVIDNSEMIVCE